MEKRKLILLKYLLDSSGEGYKIVDVSSILSSIRKYKGKYELLENDINFLKSYKFLDVKYIDEKSLCFSVLDNTRIFQENLRSEKGAHRSYVSSLILNMLFSGIMAFVGAFLAIILTR